MKITPNYPSILTLPLIGNLLRKPTNLLPPPFPPWILHESLSTPSTASTCNYLTPFQRVALSNRNLLPTDHHQRRLSEVLSPFKYYVAPADTGPPITAKKFVDPDILEDFKRTVAGSDYNKNLLVEMLKKQ